MRLSPAKGFHFSSRRSTDMAFAQARRDDLTDGAYVRLSVLSLLRKIMQHNWRSGAMELRVVGGVFPGE